MIKDNQIIGYEHFIYIVSTFKQILAPFDPKLDFYFLKIDYNCKTQNMINHRITKWNSQFQIMCKSHCAMLKGGAKSNSPLDPMCSAGPTYLMEKGF